MPTDKQQIKPTTESYPVKGTCFSCGFLSRKVLYPALQEKQYIELVFEDRMAGAGNSPLATDGELYSVWCFRHKLNLPVEIAAHAFLRGIDHPNKGTEFYYFRNTPCAAIALEHFERDRKCDQWSNYIPGFSPQEHLEMLQNEQFAELIRQSQAMQLQVTQSIERTVASMEGVAAANNQQSQRFERFSIRMTWVVAGLAFLQVALAALAIAIPLLTESRTDRLIRALIESLGGVSP